MEKIDKRLFGLISCLAQGNKIGCFIYYNNKERLKRFLKTQNIHIENEYLFIRAFYCHATKEEIFSLSRLETVEYISSLTIASYQMKISKEILKTQNFNLTGKGVGVAFIDTGIAPHCDFMLTENRVKIFKDFVKNKKYFYDDNGHGTFVCGVCAGGGYLSNFKYGGIAPKANLYVLKALGETGEATANKILDAMEWVYDNHDRFNIKVVCMSFGSEPIGYNDPIMQGANALWRDGVVVVAAAGNSGPNESTIKSPGISPEIITVGGFDDNRFDDSSYNKDFFEMASFSSRGPALRHYKPDVVAPSVDIISCGRKNFYTRLSGTSVATPMIAGVVCLMFERFPRLRPNEAKFRLLRGCQSIGFDANSEGYGVPNLSRILK